MKIKNLIQHFLPPLPELLLSVGLLIIALYSLWLGGIWWQIFLAICGIGMFAERIGLHYARLKKEKKDKEKGKKSKEDEEYNEKKLVGILFFWGIIIAVSFYGFYTIREQNFERVLHLILILIVGNIAEWFQKKWVEIRKPSDLDNETGVNFALIVSGLFGALYSGSWIFLLSGFIYYYVPRLFGGRIILSIKDDTGVKNSNILFPSQAGILDRINSYLLFGIITGLSLILGEQVEDYCGDPADYADQDEYDACVASYEDYLNYKYDD